jgi:ribosomal protein S26
MGIYLIGVSACIILCLFLHWIEIKAGCAKDLQSDIIITLFVCTLSWVGVIFCVGCIVHYYWPTKS